MIPGQHSGRQRAIVDKSRGLLHVAGEAVVAYNQRTGWMGALFEPDGYRSVIVLAARPFFEPVALYEQVATVGDVNQVTGVAVRPVGNIIADKHGVQRARLDVMPDMLVNEPRSLNVQPIDSVDIDTVRAQRLTF